MLENEEAAEMVNVNDDFTFLDKFVAFLITSHNVNGFPLFFFLYEFPHFVSAIFKHRVNRFVWFNVRINDTYVIFVFVVGVIDLAKILQVKLLRNMKNFVWILGTMFFNVIFHKFNVRWTVISDFCAGFNESNNVLKSVLFGKIFYIQENKPRILN